MTETRGRRAAHDPDTVDLLKWFDFSHLPPHLRVVSEQSHDLAWDLALNLPAGPELMARSNWSRTDPSGTSPNSGPSR
jgi:hypothetical protein